MKQRRGKWLPWIILVIVLIIISAAIAAWLMFAQPWKQPGKVIFTDNIDPSAQELVQNAISEQGIELKDDLQVATVRETTKRPQGLLYNIYLPITDFYDPISSVNRETAEAGQLISFQELDNTVKLLAIDDQYYLDTLTSGAFFEYLELKGNTEDITRVTAALETKLPEFPTKDTVLSLVQTGVTALSRGMNGKLQQVGDATYFSQNLQAFFRQFDLVHTSNEASFSAQAPSKNGTTTICALPAMIDVITSSSINIVELTGNHNQDCGDQAALDTLAQYATLGIKTFGGGATAEEAAQPLQLSEKDTNITMLGYNLSTGGYTLDNTPGANFYTREKAAADIAAAKARGDFVIIDVQFYECNNYDFTTENTTCDYANSSYGDQIGLFHELIDMGADVVVGTAAHQAQTYERYGDGAIYYGLGNLYFDQYWWPGTTRSLMLVHYFYQGQLLQTRLVPTVYDQNFQPMLMDDATSTWFIDRLNQARPQ